MSFKFSLGDIVDVEPFYHGKDEKRRMIVPGFRGVVTRGFKNGSNHACYNVRDRKTGKVWHRDEHELTAAQIVIPKPWVRFLNLPSLIALMCRKHKGEEVAGLKLHPWNARETRLQAGIRGERRAA